MIKYESMKNEEKFEKNGLGSLLFPIVIAVGMGIILFFKDVSAGYEYLVALIPMLLLIGISGTWLYNRDGDMKLFGAIACLSSIGVGLQLYIDARYITQSSFSLIKLLAGIVIAGCFVMFYRMIRKLLTYHVTGYILMAVSALLYGILIFRGIDPNGYGTSAWIRLGSITVQLTDFTKICAILYYAALFSAEKNKSDRAVLVHSSLFFGINLVGSLLIKELGSFLILMFLHLSILFIFMRRSTFKRIYLIVIFCSIFGAVAMSFILYHLISPAHDAGTMNSFQSLLWPIINKVHQRFSVTANINADPYGSGYQLYQGRKALWMAGLFGNSINFTAIPVAESDMAFVALVNSFGWIMGIFALICFTRIIISGCMLSLRLVHVQLQDSIVLFGATIMIFLQAMIVILGSCNVIPFTGLPIPFLSRGGTYQAIVFCFCGLLMLASEHDGTRLIDRRKQISTDSLDTEEMTEQEEDEDADTQTLKIRF